MAAALSREPRVVPALFAETFARPDSPAAQSLVEHAGPRMFGVLGRWLTAQIEAGRIRDAPVPLLAQELLAPIIFHLFTRPLAEKASATTLYDMDTVCEVFADGFVRAAGISQEPSTGA